MYQSTTYQPNSFLQKAVESRDTDKVRGALVGIIQSDPGFHTGELGNALAYVKSHGINPFDTQDDPQLPMTDDFARALTYLRANFTESRLKHVREVGKATHPAQNPVRSNPPGPAASSPSRVSTEVTPQKKAWGRRTVIAVLVLAALAAVVLGLSGRWGKKPQTPAPAETSQSEGRTGAQASVESSQFVQNLLGSVSAQAVR